MSDQRTHFGTTTDGVTIGGTVHGQGRPLVFLQGSLGDGDIDWNRLVEHLTGRFTCHLPSMRGRGLSGDHPDLGTSRIAADYVTYVDTIGEPCGLVGWSGGASQTLAVAAQSDLVSAVAPLEPVTASTFDEQTQPAVGDALARSSEAWTFWSTAPGSPIGTTLPSSAAIWSSGSVRSEPTCWR